MLWDASSEEIIGKKINRQGPSKKESEINDIELALNALASEQKMPMFVASSSMVMQTPAQEVLRPGLKDIEETMESLLKKRADQIVRKCDQSVSKADQSNKKMDDVIKKLEAIDRKERKTVKFAQRPEGSLLGQTMVNGNTYTNQQHIGISPPVKNPPHQNVETNWQIHPSSFQLPINCGNQNELITENQLSPGNTQAWTPTIENVIDDNYVSQPPTWASIASRAPPASINSQPPSRATAWFQNPSYPATPNSSRNDNKSRKQAGNLKQNLHLLQGTAVDTKMSHEVITPDEVNIVASKVKKDVTAANMQNWLSQKGLVTKDCKLLTTSSEAPFLSYKIKIDSKDFDRATQDANLWPYGVGVRSYVDFDKRPSDRPGNQAYGNQRSRTGYRKSVTPYRW